ncbi:uncharacterized protein LOC131683977 isoform X2 [Topomyia yanbarensis]|nr:uncharacterized protein LOC131683977 isoform X2 [Topomyia yanbarensis]
MQNNYPSVVMLMEDATRILQQAQYDAIVYRTLTGCVSPLIENEIPVHRYFDASDAYVVANHLKDCILADTAYVQLALPMAVGAAPFVLYYCGTDNIFRFTDVVNRWKYTEKLLGTEGIDVIGYSSDGDPKLVKAMVSRTVFLPCMEISRWGRWFIVNNEHMPVYIQDSIHLINKIRNRILKADMMIGNFNISKTHLNDLLVHSKDKHGLTVKDLKPQDKMKFTPTEKIMNEELVKFMEANVPECDGTATILRCMQNIHEVFSNVNLSPLERIFKLWYVLFLVRGWRNWIKL